MHFFVDEEGVARKRSRMSRYDASDMPGYPPSSQGPFGGGGGGGGASSRYQFSDRSGGNPKGCSHNYLLNRWVVVGMSRAQSVDRDVT